MCAGFGAVAALALWPIAAPADGTPLRSTEDCPLDYHSDVHFTKWIDKGSPLLFMDLPVAQKCQVKFAGVAKFAGVTVRWKVVGPPGARPSSGTGSTFYLTPNLAGTYEVEFTASGHGQTETGTETVEINFTKLPVAYKPGATPSGSSTTPTSGRTKTGGTSPTSTPTAGTSTGATAAGCAVVHSEQSCTFTATGSTIVLAGTGHGELYIENEITKQGSGFPAPTSDATFTPVKGDTYIVRDYSNADMTVRQ
jgi:type VI protein secretion system component Hcp